MDQKRKEFFSTLLLSLVFVFGFNLLFEFGYAKFGKNNKDNIGNKIVIENELRSEDIFQKKSLIVNKIKDEIIENEHFKISFHKEKNEFIITQISLKDLKNVKLSQKESDLFSENEYIKVGYKAENENDLLNYNLKFDIKDGFLSFKQTAKNLQNKDLNFVYYIKHNKKIEKAHNVVINDNNNISDFEEEKIKDLKLTFEDNSWFAMSGSNFITLIAKGIKDSKLIFKKENKEYLSATLITNIINLKQNQSYDLKFDLFAIPKRIDLLSDLSNYGIKNADKVIDFGFFYFIAKPLLKFMIFMYSFFNNYAIVIIVLTILIKIPLIPLSNKSYSMMKKLKSISPEVEKLKEIYKDDKRALGDATMKLYRDKKVNPFASLIPILIQIPIFFSLYKAFTVPIELKGATGFLWIKDLSLPDPLSIFNLFGLLSFEVPKILNIGLLPIFMGLSMFLQQKLTPTQEGMGSEYQKMMIYMPLLFTFMFASFPAGLMIYWIVNNIFTAIHQFFATRE